MRAAPKFRYWRIEDTTLASNARGMQVVAPVRILCAAKLFKRRGADWSFATRLSSDGGDDPPSLNAKGPKSE